MSAEAYVGPPAATDWEWALRSKRSGKIWHRTTSLVKAELMWQAMRHKGCDLVRRRVGQWEVAPR